MSYASIAKHNTSGPQPTPDPGLLEGSHHAGGEASSSLATDKDKVHVVPHDEGEQLLQKVHEATQDTHTVDSADFTSAKQETNKALKQADEKVERAQSDAKSAYNSAKSQGRQDLNELESKGKNLVDRAERSTKEARDAAEKKGKELRNEAERLTEKAEQKGKEIADKAEQKTKEFADEAEKQAKKASKKLDKADKELREKARQNPRATAGLLGLVNLAIVATAGTLIYADWGTSRQNITVRNSLLSVAAIAGVEGLLGYYEYEQNEKETGKKL